MTARRSSVVLTVGAIIVASAPMINASVVGASAPPSITIVAPADGDQVAQGAVVTVSFSCTDDVEIATCSGSQADGSRLDTSTLGPVSVQVTATDTEGLTATAQTTVEVVAAPPVEGRRIPRTYFGQTLPTPEAGNARFGESMDVEGDMVVLGAPGASSAGLVTGKALVYDLSSGTPSLVATLVPSVQQGNLRFGASIAISGDRIIVGAPGWAAPECQFQGGFFVFERDAGGGWAEVSAVRPPAGAYYCENRWGTELDASAGRLVIAGFYGARTYDLAAMPPVEIAPLVYNAPLDSWIQTNVQLSPSGELFASYDNRGRLVLLTWTGSAWQFTSSATPPDAGTSWSGWPMDLTDDGAVVGAYGAFLPSGFSDGTVFLFDIDASHQLQTPRRWRLSEAEVWRGWELAATQTLYSVGSVALTEDAVFVWDRGRPALLRYSRSTATVQSVTEGFFPLSGSANIGVANGRVVVASSEFPQPGFSGAGGFAVASADLDDDAPALVDITFGVSAVDPTFGSSLVPVEVNVTDAAAGLASASVELRSPNGSVVSATTNVSAQSNLTSYGFTAYVEIPQGAESGSWTISRLELTDRLGNREVRYGPQIAGAPSLSVTSGAATVSNLDTVVYLRSFDAQMTQFCGQIRRFQMIARDIPSGDERVLVDQAAACGVAPGFPQFSPDRTSLVTYVAGGNGGGEARFYDLATGSITNWIPSCHRPSWSPDGQMVLCNKVGGAAGRFTLVTKEGVEVESIQLPSSGATPVAWLSASRFLALGSVNDSSCLYGTAIEFAVLDLNSAVPTRLSTSCTGGTVQFPLSHDQSRVVTRTLDNTTLEIIEIATGDRTPIAFVAADGFDRLTDAVWSLDDQQLIVTVNNVVDGASRLEVIDLATGSQRVLVPSGLGDFRSSPTTARVLPSTTPPSPPTGVTAVGGDRAATITWLKPASDGGSPITGYTVTASPGGQTCSTNSADELSCTIFGLTNGVSYTFTVTARNEAGTGAPSTPPLDGSGNPVDPPVVVGLPPSPVTVLPPVIDPGDGTRATITWLAAASDPNLPVIGYIATASPGGQSCSTDGALSCTITGLDPTVSYTFTVVAINGVGPSPLARPDAPTAVTALTAGYREASVSWTAPVVTGGSPITSYTVTASSGGGSCSSASTSCVITGLTAGETYTFTATATNAQGVSVASAPSDPLFIGIDSTGPTVIGVADSTVNPAGWFNAPLSVAWSCADALSGVAVCPAPSVLGEGANQTVTVQATDVAGNVGVGSFGPANIDLTVPVLEVASSLEGNGAGWNNSAVTLTPTCSDALSGVAVCPEPVVFAAEGAGQVASFSAVDVAGNVASVSSRVVNIDVTAPVVSLVGPANGSSVLESDYVVPTCVASDALSGLDGVCSVTVSDPVVSPGRIVLIATATASDAAGNAASVSSTFTVLTDVAGPVINVTASPEPSDGWWNAPVTFSFSCSDPTGVAGCPTPVTVSGQGAGQSFDVSAADLAGNETVLTVSGVNIDLTLPTVTVVAPTQVGPLDTLVITCAASDALSGVASSVCEDVSMPAAELLPGANVFEFSAADVAGNVRTVSVTVTLVVPTNPAPTVRADMGVSGLNEIGFQTNVVVLTGSFSDPNGPGPFTASVRWTANGQFTPLILNNASQFVAGYIYGSSGVRTVTVRVCDAQGACGTDDVVVRSAVSQKITPVRECVIDRGAGTNPRFQARWGYNNPASFAIAVPSIPVLENTFTGAPFLRGQPQIFKPGNQRGVFTTNFQTGNHTWRINGNTATANTSSSRC